MEEKFKAAVDVISSIPYDGTFEPSNEMMLKLYAFEKQAIEGPCNIPKPYVWSISSRAKWNAWHDLGNMSKEVAMHGYVEELSKVIETMSYNDKISKFMSLMGPFYEVVSSEEADSCRNKGTSPEKSTPVTILENYHPPTILDLYHMSKNAHEKSVHQDSGQNQMPESLRYPELAAARFPLSSSSSSSDVSTFENKTYLKSGQSQLSHSFHYSERIPTYSESSSSDISNFDVLSDLSDEEISPATDRNSPKILRTSNGHKNCPFLTKKDIWILTIINLQTTMEEILEKMNNLHVLAESTNFEAPDEELPYEEWNLNLTGTAFSLIWPIIVELYIDYFRR